MKLNLIGLIYHLGVIGLKCIFKVVDNGSLVKIKYLFMVTKIIEKIRITMLIGNTSWLVASTVLVLEMF